MTAEIVKARGRRTVVRRMGSISIGERLTTTKSTDTGHERQSNRSDRPYSRPGNGCGDSANSSPLTPEGAIPKTTLRGTTPQRTPNIGVDQPGSLLMNRCA